MRDRVDHDAAISVITMAGMRNEPFPLAKLRARHVDAFVSKRREEGASENAISKELVTLRAALKLAKRAGIWKGDIGELVEPGFDPDYRPKERSLAYAEAQRLLAELTPARAARVAFIIATSANWNETERARRQDVAGDLDSVIVRGTKRASRHRDAPIVSHDQRSLWSMHARPGPRRPDLHAVGQGT